MKVLIPMTAALVTLSLLINPTNSNANASMGGAQILNDNTASANSQNPFDSQRELYDKLSSVTNVEWYWVAAVDQYERTMSRARPKARPLLGETVGVFIDKELWAGILNPDDEDNSPLSIRWFNGIGRDGDGNGIAERNSDFDLLYSLIRHTSLKGTTDEHFPIGLWDYYQNSRSVQRIEQFAAIYKHYGQLNLFEHAFPLPIGNNYSYKDTWGDKRGWGGRRTHEGTDIFAGYGTPVRSTCYGIIEIKGWNKFGGWRIGIRDLNNHYHYYAHLQGFDKTIKVGDIVEPGQVVGWVGSSGYGKPGTSGKFPPHLHYGIYSDRGLLEWAFDPYPMLRRWEQGDYRKLRSK
ncbi:M23 family metallopeptidase [Paenibacillus sp. L3-i20]|uniref:M23 family metallopeptidase n=1 Tax=Paenibacillus sp. L3-i20 TaxID=2905833 RepID=UPI001EDDB6D8|nr:M23 family metallopeptidase [Paenibacillus sp. L3-i20]